MHSHFPDQVVATASDGAWGMDYLLKTIKLYIAWIYPVVLSFLCWSFLLTNAHSMHRDNMWKVWIIWHWTSPLCHWTFSGPQGPGCPSLQPPTLVAGMRKRPERLTSPWPGSSAWGALCTEAWGLSPSLPPRSDLLDCCCPPSWDWNLAGDGPKKTHCQCGAGAAQPFHPGCREVRTLHDRFPSCACSPCPCWAHRRPHKSWKCSLPLWGCG